MHILSLGPVPYTDALSVQRAVHTMRRRGTVGDTLLLLEHPPTITQGRSSRPEHLLASESELAELGVALVATDRGGDITCHGPGQLVGYPVFDLTCSGRDLHRFLRMIEGALMLGISQLGVIGRRFPPHTGVWIGDRKVAAIGIKVSGWVSMHGFALNACSDLSLFNLIVPCGIQTHGVTSLSETAGHHVSVGDAATAAVTGILKVFDGRVERWPGADFGVDETSHEILATSLDWAESPMLYSQPGEGRTLQRQTAIPEDVH